MLHAARLHHDLDLRALDRQRTEGALVLHLVDVRAEPAEQCFPMIPAGAAALDMLEYVDTLEKPDTLKKAEAL